MKQKIVFATNNAHKLEEVAAILGENYEVLSLREIGCHDDIPETADTFSGNAIQKAQYIKEHYVCTFLNNPKEKFYVHICKRENENDKANMIKILNFYAPKGHHLKRKKTIHKRIFL